MSWQFMPHAIPLALASGFSGALALYMWRRRYSLGAPAIALLMLGASVWSLEYALQLLSANLTTQILWGKLQYLCIVFGPVVWVWFAWQYTGRKRLLKRRNLIMLLVVPLITLLLVWTNEFHGLIWRNPRLETVGTFRVKVSEYGVWFWIHTAYCYSLIFWGSLLIIKAVIRSRDKYRKQAAALLVFAVTPWLGNALYIFRLNPFPHLDLTPFTFIITGAALTWGIYRFQLANLIPIAHAKIIEGMDDAIVVLDAENRIANMNPATQRIADGIDKRVIGRTLEEVFPDLADLLSSSFPESIRNTELILGNNVEQCIYDVRISPLLNRKGQAVAKIAALRDITERKRMETELERHRQNLEETVEQRTAELSAANEQLRQEIAVRKHMEQELKRSEHQCQQILSSSYDMVIVMDSNGRVLFANNAYCDATGYTVEETNRLGLINMVHPDDRDSVRNSLRKTMSASSERGFQCRRINKNGEIRWTETNVDPIHWPGADHAILAVTRDITERKKTEDALRLSEERYHRILDSCHDMIAVVDENANLLYSNKALHEGTGYTPEDVEHMYGFDTIHPDDREKIAQWFLRVLNGEPARGVEYRGIHKSGEIRWVESNANPIEWPGAKKAVLNVLRDITDRKAAEERLRFSEERYSRILNACTESIFVFDIHAGTLYANRAWEENTGYTFKEVKDDLTFNIIHPDDLEKVTNWVQRLFSGEPLRNIEYRRVSKNGDVRWVESNADPVEWPGAENAFVNVLRDVTERRQNEAALRESEDRYRTLIDNSLTGIFVNQDGELQFVNQKFADIAGYSQDELLGIPFTELVHPEDREMARAVAARRLAREDTESHHFRAVTKAGKVIWVETLGTQIELKGKPAVLGNVVDITERKLAEEALRESEERFRSLVETSRDWIWELDATGRYTFASSRVKDILGYKPEEIIGKRPLDFVPPQKREDMSTVMRQVAESRQSYTGLENTVLHKNGREIVLESSGTPILSEDGDLLGYRGIDRDVTERKMAEEALRLSEQRYREIFWEAPDIFFTLDLETWTITDANKYALEILEYSLDDMGKTHVSDIIYPGDFERATNRLREMVIKKDRMPHFPIRVLTRSGRVIHIEQSGVIFWDDEGNARTFLGLAHDVTHIKKQERMIQERNRKLAALYDIAKSANESLHLDSVIDVVMETLPSLTESDAMCIYTFEETQQTLHYLAHRGFPEDFIRETDNLKLGEGFHGHVAQTREPLITNNLKEHPLVSRVTPLQQLQYKGAIVVPLLARGKLLGTLTVARMPGNPYTTDDIGLMTACANQIAVAMENANLYAQILQRKAHLQSILDVSRDGIIVSTAHHLIFRNEAASTIFGYPHTEDVTGIDTINFFAPESREILEDIRHRLDAGEQITETIKFKGKKRDNTTFDAEARVASFLENGQRFVVTVIRDVTQRNQMEFQLQQANKLAAIGELAAGIAHEINNPIATIEIQAGRLRDAIEDEHDGINGDFQNRLEECISQVEAQVQRCQAVTNNLLSFSRTSEIKQEQCEINHILQNTITLVTSLTHKKPTIQTSLDNNLPFFYGDPRRLEQVFVNVLNNALKAIRNDGTISVDTCVDNNNDIKIRFADSGPGIPKALLARIFDPFFTTSPEGEGTGLGLSITHFIIKEMDGKIDVESTPGQGTTFTITLPGDEKRKENIPHVT